ncbi:MAG: hypothetical protein GXN91_04080 [Epsilonproteobacteria bacterium]|nr:hypothetical protein [Campylobacterota bacterium]
MRSFILIAIVAMVFSGCKDKEIIDESEARDILTDTKWYESSNQKYRVHQFDDNIYTLFVYKDKNFTQLDKTYQFEVKYYDITYSFKDKDNNIYNCYISNIVKDNEEIKEIESECEPQDLLEDLDYFNFKALKR